MAGTSPWHGRTGTGVPAAGVVRVVVGGRVGRKWGWGGRELSRGKAGAQPSPRSQTRVEGLGACRDGGVLAGVSVGSRG